MKTKLLFLLLTAQVAVGQITFIDLLTRTTNTVSSTALITIPGVCTNAPYVVLNTNSITIGDPLPAAFAIVNANFNYFSNQLGQALSLPNQINTNLFGLFASESNRLNATGLDLTNQITTLRGNVNAATVNLTNALAQLGSDTTNNWNALGTDMTNAFVQFGNDTTNNFVQLGNDFTNRVDSVGLDLTNRVDSVGLDLTNRVEEIRSAGTGGSETVLKLQSPDGATWYLHVDNSGTLLPTTSP